MNHPIDWTLWRSFLAVAEEGGLSQAARALGLTQPTVGRHIDQLEAALGGALFTRSRAGMAPTARARALIPEAAAMASSAKALARTGRGDPEAARGVVRISASEVVGTEVLPAALAAYRRDWPGVEIELSLTNAPEDLLNRAVDIAIRMVRPTQQRLIAKRIGAAGGGLYAAKSYIAHRGAPETLEELKRHDLVGADDPAFAAMIGDRRLVADDFAIRASSDAAQMALIRAGLGIGAAQHAIARADPELERVLPDIEAFSLDVWLAMHGGLKADRIVRSAFDHLAATLYRPSER
ncbi:MAG: LysR family transcriptional regulator [Pseudomonadota bacterium]